MPDQLCPPKPRAGRITERSRDNQDIIITIDKGSNQGIGKGWTGVVFTGKSGSKVLAGSEFSIFKVTEDESYGKIRKLSLDDLGENIRVELRSPPAP
jgi:cell shape-determining protein MreC